MLDNTDKKLLYELHWNCRQSNSEMAKKLRVSKQVVTYRIAQLEKKGYIISYHALIDWRKLGYNSLRIYVRWHSIPPEVEKEIYDHIRKNPLFMWAVKLEGEVDIAFYVWVKSVPEFSKQWFEFLNKYGQYIMTQEIYESVNMVHYPMKPLMDDFEVNELVIGKDDRVEHDATDYELLKCVTENARMTIVEMTKRVNLSSRAVIQRLRKLEQKGIILNYNAFIDTDKLGYRFYKLDFYLKNYSRLKEMFEYAKTHKNVVYRMRTIGGPDFEIEVMIKGVVEMHKILDDIREKFSDSIDHHRIHRFEYTLKRIYLPGESLEQ